MNRAWAMDNAKQRYDELSRRYVMLCHGQDENGKEMAPASAATTRSLVKRDMKTLQLVIDLLDATTIEEIDVSDEAEEGFERLVEPLERHRLRRH